MSETNERQPAEVWPLASFIADEMQDRGWKAEDVAARMGTGDGFAVDLLALNMLLCVHEDNLLVSDAVFAGLARAFNLSEEYFRRFDNAWRNHPTARVAWECPEQLFGPKSRRALIRCVH